MLNEGCKGPQEHLFDARKAVLSNLTLYANDICELRERQAPYNHVFDAKKSELSHLGEMAALPNLLNTDFSPSIFKHLQIMPALAFFVNSRSLRGILRPKSLILSAFGHNGGVAKSAK